MPKKIGTHNGTFHCDEVFACYMLKQLEEYKNAEIKPPTNGIRGAENEHGHWTLTIMTHDQLRKCRAGMTVTVVTRDPSLLATCDIVVDVGGVFDPTNHRYDHHQKTFKETMNSLNATYKWTTKLSSAGLVYYHFGHRVIDVILDKLGVKTTEKLNKILYEKVYELFVEEVDGVDNGINVAEGKPRYAQTTGLSARVGHFNGWWNQEDVDDDVQFVSAMKLVGEEFDDRVNYYARCWWPARTLVEDAIDKRMEVDESGAIIKFAQGGCPWKDHLFTIEAEKNIESEIKFVLYPDQNGQWRIQCVPLMLGKFDNRLSIMAEWRGLRDQELSKLSGIPDCIFVHAGGFIGGNKTYDGALEMARKTLMKHKKDMAVEENGSGEMA